MLLIPFCCHVGKGDDGPCVPKLHEGLNDVIVLYMLFFVFAIHQIDSVDVIASCMIFCEAICFLKPLYWNCASTGSYVCTGTHSSCVHGIYMDSWSRNATSSSILAYLIPGIHLHIDFVTLNAAYEKDTGRVTAVVFRLVGQLPNGTTSGSVKLTRSSASRVNRPLRALLDTAVAVALSANSAKHLAAAAQCRATRIHRGTHGLCPPWTWTGFPLH